jgi:hypothetical protein
MALLNELTLTLIFNRILGFLVIVGVHGFALAALLRLMGDPTAKYTGRLTPNPAPHTSMLAFAMAVLFKMFWINPVKVRPENLRWGRWSLVLAAVGALIATLAIIPALSLLHPLVIAFAPRGLALTAITTLNQISDMAIWFVALNWLPVPLLTGSLIAYAAWPPLQNLYGRYQGLFTGLLVVAMIAGLLDPVIRPIHALIASWLIG